MYTLPSICEVTRKHSRWHSHSRRHDPKNASLTPDWICNLDSISSETRKKYWESSWWWQLPFPSTFSSTHWYARSSPELKKDNCPMWIESYIVSRYTCCLKQNNYICIMHIIDQTLPQHTKGLAEKCNTTAEKIRLNCRQLNCNTILDNHASAKH